MRGFATAQRLTLGYSFGDGPTSAGPHLDGDRFLRYGPTPQLGSSARLVDMLLFDRASHEALHEDGDEGADAGGVELAVEASHPILKVGSGNLFGGVAAPKSAGDLGDLLVVGRIVLG